MIILISIVRWLPGKKRIGYPQKNSWVHLFISFVSKYEPAEENLTRNYGPTISFHLLSFIIMKNISTKYREEYSCVLS